MRAMRLFAPFEAFLLKLLRSSERYTKTDMVYLASGGFWLVLGQILSVLTGLVLSIGFANLVPKDVYGTYQFIMSATIIIGAFTLTGMNTAVMRAAARGREGALRFGFKARLRWSTGIVLAAALGGLYYLVKGNETIGVSLLIVGAFSPLLGSFGLGQSYLLGKKCFRESVLFGLWRRLIPAAALLVTIAFTHDVVIIVLVYFASHTLSAALLYQLIVRRYALPLVEDEEMLSYSKHQSFLKTVGEITSQADKVLMFHYLGAEAVAAFVLAFLPIQQLESFLKLTSSLAFPKLSQTPFSDLKKTLPHKVRLLLLGALAVVAVYILIAPSIFGLVFPAYPESVFLSQVLCLTLLSKPRLLYQQAISIHHFKKAQYITNFSSIALRIGLLLLLLPQYGLLGAAAAILATHLYVNILTRYFFATAK